jgi:hypothetical protein
MRNRIVSILVFAILSVSSSSVRSDDGSWYKEYVRDVESPLFASQIALSYQVHVESGWVFDGDPLVFGGIP